MATSFGIESTVQGHHVYKSLWTPVMGEELNVQIEDSNMSLQLLSSRMELLLAMFHGSWQEPAGTFSRNGIAV